MRKTPSRLFGRTKIERFSLRDLCSVRLFSSLRRISRILLVDALSPRDAFVTVYVSIFSSLCLCVCIFCSHSLEAA